LRIWHLWTKMHLRIKISADTSAEILVRKFIDWRGISAFQIENYWFSARKNCPQIHKWTCWRNRYVHMFRL
jgi:hypothetical protein